MPRKPSKQITTSHDISSYEAVKPAKDGVIKKLQPPQARYNRVAIMTFNTSDNLNGLSLFPSVKAWVRFAVLSTCMAQIVYMTSQKREFDQEKPQ